MKIILPERYLIKMRHCFPIGCSKSIILAQSRVLIDFGALFVVTITPSFFPTGGGGRMKGGYSVFPWQKNPVRPVLYNPLGIRFGNWADAVVLVHFSKTRVYTLNSFMEK